MALSVLDGVRPKRGAHAISVPPVLPILLQRFQLAVSPDGGGRWQNVDRWPNAEAQEASRGS